MIKLIKKNLPLYWKERRSPTTIQSIKSWWKLNKKNFTPKYLGKTVQESETWASMELWQDIKKTGTIVLPKRPPIGLLKKYAQDNYSKIGHQILELCNYIFELESIFSKSIDFYFTHLPQRQPDGFCLFGTKYCSEEQYLRCKLCVAASFIGFPNSRPNKADVLLAFRVVGSKIISRPSLRALEDFAIIHPGSIQNEIADIYDYAIKIENGLERLHQNLNKNEICLLSQKVCPQKGPGCKSCNVSFVRKTISIQATA